MVRSGGEVEYSHICFPSEQFILKSNWFQKKFVEHRSNTWIFLLLWPFMGFARIRWYKYTISKIRSYKYTIFLFFIFYFVRTFVEGQISCVNIFRNKQGNDESKLLQGASRMSIFAIFFAISKLQWSWNFCLPFLMSDFKLCVRLHAECCQNLQDKLEKSAVVWKA